MCNKILSHAERMQNQRIPKEIATATLVGTRKRGRSLKTRRAETEGDLNMTVKKRQAMFRDYWQYRKIVLEAKV